MGTMHEVVTAMGAAGFIVQGFRDIFGINNGGYSSSEMERMMMEDPLLYQKWQDYDQARQDLYMAQRFPNRYDLFGVGQGVREWYLEETMLSKYQDWQRAMMMKKCEMYPNACYGSYNRGYGTPPFNPNAPAPYYRR
jgi:hypothetical protein